MAVVSTKSCRCKSLRSLIASSLSLSSFGLFHLNFQFAIESTFTLLSSFFSLFVGPHTPRRDGSGDASRAKYGLESGNGKKALFGAPRTRCTALPIGLQSPHRRGFVRFQCMGLRPPLPPLQGLLMHRLKAMCLWAPELKDEAVSCEWLC